jgi:type IV pilus assembly protein PilN
MIRINLLPTKRKKKAKPVPMYLAYSGIALAASLAVLFFFNSYMNSRIKALETDKSNKTAELKRLNDLIKHVKDFEAKKADLENRIKVILGIAEKKPIGSMLIDEMTRRLTEGIWLTNMDFKVDSVKIAGVGFNNADIVSYVEHLKDNETVKIYPNSLMTFTNVKLHGTQKVKQQNQTVYKFTISMKIKVIKKEEDKGAGNGA